MNINIVENLSLGEFLSPRRDLNRPIYNWHAFKHSYTKDLVDVILDKFDIERGDWVLDPFVGGGTTMLACKEKGVNGFGTDILPFSCFLSKVKTSNYNSEELESSLGLVLSSNRKSKVISSDVPTLKLAFSTDVYQTISNIYNSIQIVSDESHKEFLLLSLLSILDQISNAVKAGGFLRIVEKIIDPKSVLRLFEDKARSMISDIRESSYLNMQTATSIILECDARQIHSRRKFDAVITSPPYPNRHDYTRIYLLELAIGFLRLNSDVKSLRYKTLRSHVEARKQFRTTEYKEPEELASLLKTVRKNGTNNPQVVPMIEGYFEDMYLVLCEIKKRLKKNGKVAMIVSNVRFAGTSVLVDEILATIGEQAGLSLQSVTVLRYRGNSSQQMRDYKKAPTRESMVVWSN